MTHNNKPNTFGNVKRLVSIFCFVVCICFLTACSGDQDQNQGAVQSAYDSHKMHIYVDPETGVNYLVYESYRRGGVSVRYNADGTLYVSDIDAKTE